MFVSTSGTVSLLEWAKASPLICYVNGNPVYIIAGGAEDAGGDNKGGADGGKGTDGGSGGSDGGGTNDAGGNNEDGKGADDAGGAKGPDGKTWDPERAERTITKMRDERRQEKQEFETFKATHTKTMDGIARALGLKKDDELTPEKLQQELAQKDGRITELEGTVRDLMLRTSVNSLSMTKNAIAELVWGQLQASGGLKDIDLSAADYEDKVGTLIDDTLKKYPQLKRGGRAERDAGERGATDGGEFTTVNDAIRRAAGRR